MSSATAAHNQTQHDFTGLELGQVYTVSLTCIFWSVQQDCGTTTLRTRHPALVVGTQVYYQLGTARSWLDSHRECRAGDGHLVSLGDAEKERIVMERIDVSDIWTGGNMCQDSPGWLK